MIIIYILLGIITAFVVLNCILNFWRADALDEREEALDKYSVYLDERADMLALLEKELKSASNETHTTSEKNH